jgi:hypothetical protein
LYEPEVPPPKLSKVGVLHPGKDMLKGFIHVLLVGEKGVGNEYDSFLGLVSRVRGVDSAVRHVLSDNIDDCQDFVMEVVLKICIGLGQVFGLICFDLERCTVPDGIEDLRQLRGIRET